MVFNPSGLMIYFNLMPFVLMCTEGGDDGSCGQIKCGFAVFKGGEFNGEFRFNYDIFGMLVAFLILGESEYG